MGFMKSKSQPYKQPETDPAKIQPTVTDNGAREQEAYTREAVERQEAAPTSSSLLSQQDEEMKRKAVGTY